MKITSCNVWAAITDLKPACDLKIVNASPSFITMYLIICISVPFSFTNKKDSFEYKKYKVFLIKLPYRSQFALRGQCI
jgi:hypothetical protein